MPKITNTRAILWCLEELGVEYRFKAGNGTPTFSVKGKPLDPTPSAPLTLLKTNFAPGLEFPAGESTLYWARFAEKLHRGDVEGIEEVELFLSEGHGAEGEKNKSWRGVNFTGRAEEIGAADFMMSTPISAQLTAAKSAELGLTETVKWLERMAARPAWGRAAEVEAAGEGSK